MSSKRNTIFSAGARVASGSGRDDEQTAANSPLSSNRLCTLSPRDNNGSVHLANTTRERAEGNGLLTDTPTICANAGVSFAACHKHRAATQRRD